MPLSIEIADEQRRHAVDAARLAAGARSVLAAAGIEAAEVSIAVVDDDRMHTLNRQYLAHDYPTDVLSFVLEFDAAARRLEGEVVVSADYAAREAQRYGWRTEDELLLYVIHGCLHLVGFDDATSAGRQAMRAAEAERLAQFGLTHRYDPS